MNDKDLIQKLSQLKNIEAAGAPSKDFVASNREILMSQIKPASVSSSPVEKAGEASYYIEYFNNLFRQRILKPAMATFVIVLMLLAYTATLSVASASLPGDAMYSVKTAKERVQMAFTFGDEDKVMLQMTFISRRSEELKKVAVSDDDSATKQENIEKTAKKIAQDIQVVKERLNKITIASMDTANESVLAIAKEIDTKTLEVKQNIIITSEILPADVQVEVSEELKKAIDTTESTGADALAVIITQYEGGKSELNNEEVASRVADRIKDAESGIVLVTIAVEGVATTTADILISLEDMSETTATSTIETLEDIKDKPQEAQDAIDEAKELLDLGDFASALEKITETNNIVGVTGEDVQIIIELAEEDAQADSGNATSTGQVLGDSELNTDNDDNTSITVEITN